MQCFALLLHTAVLAIFLISMCVEPYVFVSSIVC